MIFVSRQEGDSTTKLVSKFMKRTKKYNLVARSRKTKHFAKPISHLKKKQKLSTQLTISKNKNPFFSISQEDLFRSFFDKLVKYIL